jgi:hypothetical protein
VAEVARKVCLSVYVLVDVARKVCLSVYVLVDDGCSPSGATQTIMLFLARFAASLLEHGGLLLTFL